MVPRSTTPCRQLAVPEVPIATMTKRYEGSTYLFTVCMRNQPTKAWFEMRTSTPDGQVTVLAKTDRST